MAKDKLKICVGVSVCDGKHGNDADFADFGLVYHNANEGVLQTVWETLADPEISEAVLKGLMPLFAKLKDLGWELQTDNPKVHALEDKVRHKNKKHN